MKTDIIILYRYVPLCIKHHQGDVLDIVLSTSEEVELSTATSIMTLAPGQASTSTNAPIDTSGLSSDTLTESVSDLDIASGQFAAPLSTESQQADLASANTTHIQSLFHSITTAVVLASQAGTPLSSEQIMALA